MGALVFQMPIDRLNTVLQAASGLGETGETYIVGSDYLRRSDSRLSDDPLILKQQVRNTAVQQALAGETGIVDVVGSAGEDAVSAYRPLDFAGTRWALAAEIDAAELKAAIDQLRNRFLIVALIFAGFSGVAGILGSRAVTRPMSAITMALGDLLAGRAKVVPGTDRNDEIGDLARAFASFAQEGVAASRIKLALDNADVSVMVADANYDIVYVNRRLLELFRVAETDIRQDLPSFRTDGLIGSNIDQFHKDPSHQHHLLAKLSGTHKAEIKIGKRDLTFVANPVLGNNGERLGTVVEWHDMTEELALRGAVETLLDAANQGDFSRRIEASGMQGTMARLAGGINQLTKLVEGATKDLGGMLGALAEGDLTRRITADYQGTLGELKDNANRTAEQLAEIVGQIQTATQEVENAASEIGTGTEDLSKRTEQAASSIEETAASTEQMAATVKQNAESARNASELASGADQSAKTGGEVVEKAVCAMAGIEQSAQRITDIISVIDEIAFQTNLLALNASVEAARAGEAGKGFAVVAQEVRQLAQRSAQAASDIKTLIQDSNGQVKDGVDLVNRAGEALTEIVGSIGKVTGIVQEISSASQEQAAGVQEINSSITSMDEMTQQNSALVEESSAAARALSDQATKLAQLMDFFKLGGAGPSNRRQPRASKERHLAPATATAIASADDGWNEF